MQVPQLQVTAMKSQRFAPLIYGEPICKLHRSLYRGISACPTRDSLTFTCGLRVPTCRILVTTISSQSRQEITMSTNNGPIPPACPYVGGNINLDSSKEKTDFDNFFSNDPIKYWILFSFASASLIFTVNYLFAIISISCNHLEESRKLFSSFSEYSDDGLAKITNLRTAAQSATFHLVISLSIFILCFFNPIRTIFKNNTKKHLQQYLYWLLKYQLLYRLFYIILNILEIFLLLVFSLQSLRLLSL